MAPVVGQPERSNDPPCTIVALTRDQQEPNGSLALEIHELRGGCGRERRELMPVSRDAGLRHAPNGIPVTGGRRQAEERKRRGLWS